MEVQRSASLSFSDVQHPKNNCRLTSHCYAVPMDMEQVSPASFFAKNLD